MGKYILIVPSSPLAGQGEEYNRWYDDEHIADLLKVPGVVAGRRYDALPASPDRPAAEFLAIYEIEADDPNVVLEDILSRSDTAAMPLSPAIDMSTVQLWLYRVR